MPRSKSTNLTPATASLTAGVLGWWLQELRARLHWDVQYAGDQVVLPHRQKMALLAVMDELDLAWHILLVAAFIFWGWACTSKPGWLGIILFPILLIAGFSFPMMR